MTCTDNKYNFLLFRILTVFFVILFYGIFPCVAENKYKINSIRYEISGITRDTVLSQKLNIDTETVFPSQEELSEYLTEIKQNIENFRVIETSEITESYSQPDESGLIYVDLLIKASDSINFVIVPYPKYDVNTGFELKLKIKDYKEIYIYRL